MTRTSVAKRVYTRWTESCAVQTRETWRKKKHHRGYIDRSVDRLIREKLMNIIGKYSYYSAVVYEYDSYYYYYCYRQSSPFNVFIVSLFRLSTDSIGPVVFTGGGRTILHTTIEVTGRAMLTDSSTGCEQILYFIQEPGAKHVFRRSRYSVRPPGNK